MSDIIDTIDLAILELLHEDGRATNLDIADTVGLSPSPCLRRIRRLESDGTILGYRANLDWRKLGLGLEVFMSVSLSPLEPSSFAEFSQQVAEIPEIIECVMLAGETDFILRVVAKDLEEYQELVLSKLVGLPHIRAANSMIVLKSVKSTTPFDAISERAS